MTEDAPAGPRTPAEFAEQLRAVADRMMAGWTGTSAPASPPVMPGLPPLPATMSANQIQALLDDIEARRAQVQALRTQLEGFDEQLGNFEAGVRPFLEWTRAWADLEKTMSGFWGPPSGTSGR